MVDSVNNDKYGAREIYTSFGVRFPKVPGKVVRFFCFDGSLKTFVEVFKEGLVAGT